MTKTVKIICLILTLSLLGCIERPLKDDYRNNSYETRAAVHLYLNPADTGNSLLSSVRRDTFPFEDLSLFGHEPYWDFDSCQVKVYPYIGFSVIPKTGNTAYFLNVIGIVSLSRFDNTHFKAKSSIGDAFFDMSNPDSVKAIYFRFHYPGYPPPLSSSIYYSLSSPNDPLRPNKRRRLFFMCPEPSDKIIYGWTIEKTDQAKCYKD
jgi:hypothetical protein